MALFGGGGDYGSDYGGFEWAEAFGAGAAGGAGGSFLPGAFFGQHAEPGAHPGAHHHGLKREASGMLPGLSADESAADEGAGEPPARRSGRAVRPTPAAASLAQASPAGVAAARMAQAASGRPADSDQSGDSVETGRPLAAAAAPALLPRELSPPRKERPAQRRLRKLKEKNRRAQSRFRCARARRPSARCLGRCCAPTPQAPCAAPARADRGTPPPRPSPAPPSPPRPAGSARRRGWRSWCSRWRR